MERIPHVKRGLTVQYRNELYPKPFDEKSIYLKMTDLEENTWKGSISRIANNTTNQISSRKSVFEHTKRATKRKTGAHQGNENTPVNEKHRE
ncbi:hypothetical protein TNCV_2441461 [Trichonephila clavipes]|nr:hypothetical protein TNCV_2441461 [Trichonephila clavipes]